MVIIFGYRFYIISKQKNSIRSPFQFIKRFNLTYNENYWDEFKKPLRHLTGVEVGVFQGKFSEKIVHHLNIRELYLVDPWSEYVNFNADSGLVERDQSDHNKNFELVKKKFSKYQNVKIIRKKSVDASKDFPDAYFDFIYLDGDHSYEEVKNDLYHWYSKLKKYGVMCGDDYGHISGTGVIQAVQEFAFEKN